MLFWEVMGTQYHHERYEYELFSNNTNSNKNDDVGDGAGTACIDCCKFM